MDVQPVPVSAARPKVNNACEACRAAKVRCQPSVQSGICRRCLEFKRECIFRTGPRTRRPRQSRHNQDAPRLPPPPGPSKTFSINFDMPAPEDVTFDALESLASRHESYIEHLLPPDDFNHAHTPMFDDLMLDALNAFHHPGGIALTPPASLHHQHQHHHHHHQHHSSPHSASSAHSHHGGGNSSGSAASSPAPPMVSISNIGMKPQFNLDSASRLLDDFKVMLTHFPCILLPEDATVASLAKSRPFVLLAILSVASGAGSLQGHTLYDDEFRKILGLKFVAGGERSVELLQGLLIYTAWYPFHLRPKNKQAFQYVRMASEIAHDLELVCPPDDDPVGANTSPVSSERLEGMRTYLSCFYLVRSFMVTWLKLAVIGLEYNNWTATCCDVLERHPEVEGDQRLASLVRAIHIIDQTGKIDRHRNGDDPLQDEQEARFMIRGIEAQFHEWKANIPQQLIMAGSALHIATTFAELYLYASPLLRFGSPRTGPRAATIKSPIDPEPARLARCLPILRRLFDDICALPQAAFIPVTAIDWGKIIQITILALRLSLPLPSCPSWDDAAAREALQFGAFLERFSRPDDAGDGTTPSSGINVLSASKIVFNVVRHKYEGRLAKIQVPELPLVRGLRGCPMLDGSLEEYFPSWDPAINTPPSLTGGTIDWSSGHSGTTSLTGEQPLADDGEHHQQQQPPPPLLNDMWSTMTQSWPNDDDMMMTQSMIEQDEGAPSGAPGCPVNHAR